MGYEVKSSRYTLRALDAQNVRPLSDFDGGDIKIVSKRRALDDRDLMEQNQSEENTPLIECFWPHDVNHYQAAQGDKFLIF